MSKLLSLRGFDSGLALPFSPGEGDSLETVVGEVVGETEGEDTEVMEVMEEVGKYASVEAESDNEV